MSYAVLISSAAERELARLSEITHARLTKRILALEKDPRPSGVKKLAGRSDYRLRVGDYRVLYVVNDREKIVTILAVGHRRDVYQ